MTGPAGHSVFVLLLDRLLIHPFVARDTTSGCFDQALLLMFLFIIPKVKPNKILVCIDGLQIIFLCVLKIRVCSNIENKLTAGEQVKN